MGYGGWIQLERDVNQKSAKMMKDNGDFFRSVNDNLWCLETRLKDMDENGVQMQVLSTVPVMFSYWAKPQDALYLSQQLNNHIAYCVQEYPTRFVGLGTIPMQSPELAVQELQRCCVDLKMKGVQIGTHVNDWNLDDPHLDCIYKVISILVILNKKMSKSWKNKAAQELDFAIFVHPWEMQCDGRMKPYWLPWLTGMPFETTNAISCMIFGGIFERFPNLRVCFAHGGGAFPFTVARIEHGFNVRPDLCAVKIKKSPRHYIDRIYVDCLVHDADALKFLIQTLGEVMLGSDYPFPLGEQKPGQLAESTLNKSSRVKPESFIPKIKKNLDAECNYIF
uniref:2-amino-3-carboxymuconate-6-semialdehyde decarboxylase n=1 Tax=Strigamia maritima TaxID=126957 RepID=T1JJ58_STRMM